MKPMTPASLLDQADWTFPIPVFYGPGRLSELASIAASAGMTRPLVVTDRGSRELPFLAEAVSLLREGGLLAELFAEISPNPTDADISAGREMAREGDFDGVIAIGGGSGMDGGKSISLVARNDEQLWAFDYDAPTSPPCSPDDFVPLLCVPTTAGTGAETESTAMVTDTERGIKRCVWHNNQRPAAAILDPAITVGLPPSLTAWTGIDALVHAIEAYSVPVLHPLCDGLALEAMRLIGPALRRAVVDGADLEARGAMLMGSCLAGVSFLKGLGLVHAMSHMVGAVYNTHHGLTNAVLLPIVLRANREALAGKVEPMCDALGLDGRGFDDLYGWVVALLDDLSIPTGLAELGVGDERLGELAAKSHGDAAAATNPAQFSVEEIEGVLTEALAAAR